MDGMQIHRNVTPSIKFPTTRVERGTVKVVSYTTQCPRQGLEPVPLDLYVLSQSGHCISLISYVDLYAFLVIFLLFFCCGGCEFLQYCKVQWIVDNSRWGISSYDEESSHQ